jgi:hypothetical protein
MPSKEHIRPFSIRRRTKDDSNVSLKSRIREAQREAARRVKPAPRRHAGDKDAPAKISSQDATENETKEATPTVDEIRTALLRKSANGRKAQ